VDELEYIYTYQQTKYKYRIPQLLSLIFYLSLLGYVWMIKGKHMRQSWDIDLIIW